MQEAPQVTNLTGIKPLRLGGGDAPQIQPLRLAPTGASQAKVYDTGKVFTTPRVAVKPAKEYTFQDWLTQQKDDVIAPIEAFPYLLNKIQQGFRSMPDDLKAIGDELFRNPYAVAKATQNVIDDFWTLATDHYREDGKLSWGAAGRAVYQRPLLVLSDLTMAASLAGVGLKGAAQTALRIGSAGGKATSAKAIQLGRHMYNAGQVAEKIGNWPFALAGKAINAFERIPAVNKIETVLGITPRVRAAAQSYGAEKLRANEFANRGFRAGNFGQGTGPLKMYRLFPKELEPRINDVLTGRKPLIRNEWTPEQFKAFEAWSEYQQMTRESYKTSGGYFSSGLITEQALERSQLKHMAYELRGLDKQGLVNVFEEKLGKKGLTEAEAVDMLGAMPDAEVDRLLGPLNEAEFERAKIFREGNLLQSALSGSGDVQAGFFHPFVKAREFDLGKTMEAMYDPFKGSTKGYIARFERLRGRRPVETNPSIVQARVAQTNADFLGSINGVRRVLMEHGKPWSLANEVPPGYKIFPRGFMEKYINIHDEAQRVAWNSYVEGIAGNLPDEAIYTKVLGDIQNEQTFGRINKELKDAINQADTVIVPDDIAKMLETELGPVTGLLKLYDTAMDYWKYLALTFNPAFYMNNIVGNHLLQMFAGVNPWRMDYKAYENIPAEASRSASIVMENGLAKAIPGVEENLRRVRAITSKLAEGNDAWARTNIMNAELEKLVRQQRGMQDLIRPLSEPELQKIIQASYNARKISQEVTQEMIQSNFVDFPKIKRVSKATEDFRAQAGRQFNAATGDEMLGKDSLLSFVGPQRNAGRQAALTRRLSKAATKSALENTLLNKIILKRLGPDVETLEKAIVNMERLMGAYGRITPFARKTFRRAIPFWTFMSAMWRTIITAPLVRPKTYWMWNRISQMAVDAYNDERLPSALKGTIMIGYDRNPKSKTYGKMIFARVNGWNPFNAISFRERKLAEGLALPVPNIFDPSTAPFIAAAHKLIGGYDTFSQAPPDIENMEIMDNWGRAYRYDPAQRVMRRITPQSNILDAIAELVPHVSILNDFMTTLGFDAGAAGLLDMKDQIGKGPRLYKDTEGHILNPRHMEWTLGRIFGVSVESMDMEAARRSDQLTRIKLLKLYQKRAMTLPPEERGPIFKIIYDLLEEDKVNIKR